MIELAITIAIALVIGSFLLGVAVGILQVISTIFQIPTYTDYSSDEDN